MRICTIAVFRNNDVDIAVACREASVAIAVSVPTDPETTPEAILETHREIVRKLWRRGLRDVKAISEAAVLPVWNVQRQLFAMGLGPNPYKRPVAPPGSTPGDFDRKTGMRKPRKKEKVS